MVEEKNFPNITLGDVSILRNETINPSNAIGARYVGLEHIDTGNPVLTKFGGSGEVRSTKKRFFPGDILYGKLRPYLDKAVLAGWDGICSTDILVLTANSKAIPEYLVYLLHTNDFLDYAIKTTSGVNHPRTSWQNLKDFSFPIPSFEEQKAIANVLTIVHGAIEATERVIEATRQLKKSMMKHLFTYGPVPVNEVDQVKLKETEIGKIPDHWEVKKISDLIKNVRREKQWGQGRSETIPFISMADIPIDQMTITNWDDRTENEIKSGIIIHDGDFLLAKITPCFENGKQGIIANLPSGWGYATTEVIPIRTTSELHIELLAHYLTLQNIRQSLANKMEGTTGRQRLSKSALWDLTIPVPPDIEQSKIITILTTLDNKIDIEVQRKKAFSNIFQSLLEQLMS